MPIKENIMNYLKVYCNLIRKAEKRGYTKKKAKEQELYVEGHHTFPISIYGKNRRIVYLTAREHYIAHSLLEKICIKRYGLNHWKTLKMIKAHISMTGSNNKMERYKNSFLYEKCRIRFSEKNSGSGNPMYGKTQSTELIEYLRNRNFSKETRKKMSIKRKQRVTKQSTKNLVSKSCEKFIYRVLSPTNVEYIITNARKFCRENNLDCSSMIKVSKEKMKNYKGWYMEKIGEVLTNHTLSYIER
jgi:hypothetical protein